MLPFISFVQCYWCRKRQQVTKWRKNIVWFTLSYSACSSIGAVFCQPVGSLTLTFETVKFCGNISSFQWSHCSQLIHSQGRRKSTIRKFLQSVQLQHVRLTELTFVRAKCWKVQIGGSYRSLLAVLWDSYFINICKLFLFDGGVYTLTEEVKYKWMVQDS